MFKKISNYFNKKNLKDKKYSFLFDKHLENEYVCFDCETTGLDPKIDDIISIGAVIIKNNTIVSSKKFVRYIKPKNCSLDEKSIKIHHIRECDLKNGCEIDDVILEFLEFIGNRTLVGYFLDFDKNMINKYLKPLLGITLPNRSIEVSEIYHEFKTIVNDLDIPEFGNHDSYNDAIMTAMIFLKLKNHPNVKIK